MENSIKILSFNFENFEKLAFGVFPKFLTSFYALLRFLEIAEIKTSQFQSYL